MSRRPSSTSAASAEGIDEPVGPLRGAGVPPGSGRVLRVAASLLFAALALGALALFGGALRKNAQIDRLRQHGTPVVLIVSSCLGQLGGSGSNAAGYFCTGSYSIGLHTYTVSIPGSSFYSPGTQLLAIAVARDPSLVAFPNVLAHEHTSSRPYVLPSVLLAVAVLGGIGLNLNWHRRRRSKQPRHFAGATAVGSAPGP